MYLNILEDPTQILFWCDQRELLLVICWVVQLLEIAQSHREAILVNKSVTNHQEWFSSLHIGSSEGMPQLGFIQLHLRNRRHINKIKVYFSLMQRSLQVSSQGWPAGHTVRRDQVPFILLHHHNGLPQQLELPAFALPFQPAERKKGMYPSLLRNLPGSSTQKVCLYLTSSYRRDWEIQYLAGWQNAQLKVKVLLPKQVRRINNGRQPIVSAKV